MEQQYRELKQELKQLIEDRKVQEDRLDQLQQEIYDKETEYFDLGGATSKSYHNILRGFDGMNRNSGNSNNGSGDRIFSLSSASYVKQEQNT
ncbi:Chromatin modification-related protein EAF6 [Nakaseomyces bracarensis]|uniref:Chromatin modification-related protein EAF6 n=1 Tax=Nakaseomyces bracarensis TaxID=273131 RepID=A0ABR4NQ19_9SACH